MVSKKTVPVNFQVSLAAGEETSIDFRQQTTTDENGQTTDDKQPFSNAQAINQGNDTALIRINGEPSGRYLAGGSFITLEDQKIRKIEIENTGANPIDIDLSLDNNETEKSILRDIRERL